MRFAIGLIIGATLATPIAGAVAYAARESATDEIRERHVTLDAEYRMACARGVAAGWAWRELAEAKATGLTDDRVWVTTLEEGP